MKRTALLATAIAALLATGVATMYTAEAGNKGAQRGAKMFDRVDTNGDGKITQDEFMARSAERFDMMDQDGNGEVTKEEAQKAYKEMRAKRKGMGKGGSGNGQGSGSGQQ